MANRPVHKMRVNKETFLTALHSHGYTVNALCMDGLINRTPSTIYRHLSVGYMPDEVLYGISKATGISMGELSGNHVDSMAREILAYLADVPIDTPLDKITAKLIFGDNRSYLDEGNKDLNEYGQQQLQANGIFTWSEAANYLHEKWKL